jgi:threonine/homoserine/homoserine lactone efflux protein
LLGGGYLIYLGFRLLLCRATQRSAATPEGSGHLTRIYAQGFFANLTNPKVALFFLAFLPRFIDGANPSKTAAFLTLGFAFVATATL